MSTFKLRPEGLIQQQRRFRYLSIVLTVLLCGALLVALLVKKELREFWPVVAIPLVLAPIMSWFSGRRRSRQQAALYESYLLTVTGTGVQREMAGYPTIQLSKDEITEIRRSPRGAYSIRGQRAMDAIQIPHFIENEAQLRGELNAFRAVHEMARAHWTFRYRGAFVVLMMVSFGLIFWSNNRWVVGGVGLYVIPLVGWSVFHAFKSKNHPLALWPKILITFVTIMLLLRVLGTVFPNWFGE